jgi:hypothetical protein
MSGRESGPSVAFGLTLIASSVILFLSVVRPESQRAPEIVWEVDESLSLRTVVGAALLPAFFSADGRPLVELRDVWQNEEIWAAFDPSGTSHTTPPPPPYSTHRSPDSKPSSADTTPSQATRERFTDDEGAKCYSSEGRGRGHGEGRLQSKGLSTAGLRTIGVNLSLIPGTGWGHLGYELFFGLRDAKEGLGWNPLLLGAVHPSALQNNTRHADDLIQVLRTQASQREDLAADVAERRKGGAGNAGDSGMGGARRVSFPVLHAVDHLFFHRPRVIGAPNIGYADVC